MGRYRYSRYIPRPAEDVDLDELIEQLKDLFLQSGFYSQFYPGEDTDPTQQNLMQALAAALAEDEMLPEEWRDELRRYAENPVNFQPSKEVRELLERLIERLLEEGFLNRMESSPDGSGHGEMTESQDVEARFELTDKSIDFLGYSMLRQLMSAVGRSGFGRHLTNDLSTGVESNAHSRPYEFGDTLNLDVGSTLLRAVRREGLGVPLNLEYSDLMVHQTERRSSCATALMLDCSHSMILYGEDRFTPAKSVALALAHLIRTQYPGDTLEVVLFHDSAERIPLARLPMVKVGPFHTNTCEGLRLARRLLLDQRKEMRQIVMITDGKPSALTMPDGRIYKNAWGLDPFILEKTYEEVAKCRKSGILINTFMLARDWYLVDFVKKVSQICRGKAYLTTTVNLADYILMDFMSNKSTTVH
jgi:Ca-activated chloride channel family protein